MANDIENNDNLSKRFFFARRMNRYKELATASPEEVNAIIEKALMQHRSILATGNKRAIGASMKELEQMRRLVHAGTANAGQYERGLIMTLNNSVIQTEKAMERIGDKQNDNVKRIGNGIKNSLPSVDAIIGAAAVANPIFGFGLNAARSILEQRKEAKIEAAKQTEEIQRIIDEGLEGNADELEKANEELVTSSDNDEVVGRLERIESGIKDQTNFLVRAWGDEKDILERMERDSDEELKRMRDQDMDNLESELEAKSDTKENMPDINIEQDSGMSGLMALYFMRPLRRVFGAVGRVAASVAGLLGRGLIGALRLIAGPIGLAIGATLAFMDGWNDAAEILNKSEEDLTASDKIAAGIGGILGVIGSIADWVTSLFGVETDVASYLRVDVAQGLASFFDTLKLHMTDMFEFFLDTIPSYFSNFMDYVGDVYSEIGSFFSDKIPNFVQSKFDEAVDGFFGIFESVEINFNEYLDMVKDIGKRIKAGIRSVIEPYLPDRDGALGFVYDIFDFWSNEPDAPVSSAVSTIPSTAERIERLEMIRQSVERRNMMSQNNFVVAPQTNVNNQQTMWTTPLSTSNRDNLVERVNRDSMGYAF